MESSSHVKRAIASQDAGGNQAMFNVGCQAFTAWVEISAGGSHLARLSQFANMAIPIESDDRNVKERVKQSVPAVTSVYFDTQVFDAIGSSIPADDWNKVVEAARAGRFRYCVSINTLYELFHGLANGSAEHFARNKDRLLRALNMEGAELLPFTGEFLRRTLGLATRPDLGHYMVELLKPVLDRASKPEDLLSASQNVQAQVEFGKKVWIRELNRAVSRSVEIPRPLQHATFIALENGIPNIPENLQQIAERLDAAYTHMVIIIKAVMNADSRYKHEEKASDWLDNQQLYYLGDPTFLFVTLEQKLIKKIAGSSQANRVLRFPEFLSSPTVTECC